MAPTFMAQEVPVVRSAENRCSLKVTIPAMTKNSYQLAYRKNSAVFKSSGYCTEAQADELWSHSTWLKYFRRSAGRTHRRKTSTWKAKEKEDR